MQQAVRVDLIFPRSGQIIPVFVPNALLSLVSERNLQVLLSLYEHGISTNMMEYETNKHYPS